MSASAKCPERQQRIPAGLTVGCAGTSACLRLRCCTLSPLVFAGRCMTAMYCVAAVLLLAAPAIQISAKRLPASIQRLMSILVKLARQFRSIGSLVITACLASGTAASLTTILPSSGNGKYKLAHALHVHAITEGDKSHHQISAAATWPACPVTGVYKYSGASANMHCQGTLCT